MDLEAYVCFDFHLHLDLTIAHGFFIIMGGFHLVEEDSPSELPAESNELASPRAKPSEPSPPRAGSPWLPRCSRPLYPLDGLNFGELVEDGTLTFPTESEIKDRSKSDWLAKSLALVQTSWFVIQCIARTAARLPVTELELVTLAYATMTLGIYLAWWDKPRNVVNPIRVFRKPAAEDGEKEGWSPGVDHFVETRPDDDTPRSAKSRQQWRLW